jgi:Protein of unknown function (DUF2726)
MIQSNPYYQHLRDGVLGLTTAEIAALCLGMATILLVLIPRRRIARRPWQSPAPNLADPATQMQAIAQVDFETRRLLNREEAPLLPLIERILRTHGDGHRVMAQTSMGEIIRPREGSATRDARNAAHAAINAKRLDFAIFNRFGHLVAAVEYQGTGHYQNNAFMRDAVKREAIRKAGVPYIEVPAKYDTEDVTRQIIRIVAPQTAPSASIHVLHS